MNSKRLGAIFWILCLQYFAVQFIVAAVYIGKFSLAHNTISDLGNTVCGMYADRYVCSPAYILMNISFIILGLTQLLGAIVLYKVSEKNRRNLTGFGFMVLAGIGTIIVGLFPENTIGQLHAVGAALPFIFGNIAMLLLAGQAGLPTWLRYFSYASGLAGLVALILFMTNTYFGIGHGGMERIVAYPQTIWMIIIGMYFLMHSNQSNKTK